MTVNEKPGTWEEWRAQHPKWPLRIGRIEWRLEWLVYWCRDLAFFEVLEFAGRVSVLVAVIFWFLEWGDRTKQSHYRAWELINSARGSTGDGGRRDALQDLNDDDVSLAAAPLARAQLYDIKLQNADLSDADLNGANLRRADLTGAWLGGANLAGADMRFAKLTGAIMYGADLAGARLWGADLTKATLTTANLTDAELIDVKLAGAHLREVDLTSVKLTPSTRAELDKAILCETVMPDGIVSDRDCSSPTLSPVIWWNSD